ncbi:glycosyltransferase family 2 protein [Mesorhizobium abyssinicae]|uniref:glycosyltransferase family 2 protein n=1 Tax=Mesorhizobium abyssinicae TaxID=1209958 RepID=UPI003397B6EE
MLQPPWGERGLLQYPPYYGKRLTAKMQNRWCGAGGFLTMRNRSVLMPSVDVVIPNYQYGRFLPGCINSVLSQDVENLRVLVIDNASTDDSLEVARALAATDRRIQIVAHPVNVGVTASMNEGIDQAAADYFTILCSDDILAPGSLSRAISIMEKHPTVTVAQGAAQILDFELALPTGPTTTDPPAWTIISGSEYIENICRRPLHRPVGFILVRTAAQKQAGYYTRELPFTNDLEMLMRLVSIGDVAETNTIQGIRREHKNNISSAYWQDFKLRLDAVYRAVEAFLSSCNMAKKQSAKLLTLARVNLACDAYWSAVSHLIRGRYREAFELFKFAFSLSPHLAILPPVAHLLRTKNVLSRTRMVFSEAFGRG